MNFSEPRVQEYYYQNFKKSEDTSCESRQIRALVAVHEFFYSLEGSRSSGVHEAIWHLLLPKLRSELRRWYQNLNCAQSEAEIVLRDHLRRFLKEEL